MKRFKIDFSFFVLLAIISLSPKQNIVLKLLFCLLIHELGHLFFVFIFRYKIDHLKLSLFGFFMKLSSRHTEWLKDILLYSGGILMNVLCYVIFPDPVLRKVNLLLLLFNCLPIYPLDGFQILQTFLAYFLPYRIVLKGMSIFGMVFSAGFFIFLVYLKMDLFVLCNVIYLVILSTTYYFKEEEFFQKFLLDKALYQSSYPIRKIKFQEQWNLCFYKYHTVEIELGRKKISERDILQTKQLFE